MKQNIKEMNGFLFAVLFILIAAISGVTSYALFKTKVEGENGLTLVVNNNFCIRNKILKLSDCMVMSENENLIFDDAKTIIVNKGTPDFSKIAPASDTDTSNGLYASLDADGTSYYYRGDVKNNYVSYAGFIWRIIRRNGDGSVRMIYQGKSVTDKANPITTGYNTSFWDPAFDGYMYTKDFERKDGTVTTPYVEFSENKTYYFGTSYTFDATTERFQLSGEMKSGTWEATHLDAQNKYYYTCFETSADATCPVLMKIMGYDSSIQARVRLISYSSKSYERAVENTTSSNAKLKLDSWYETNILNKKDANNHSYADYVNDEVFCNDRNIMSGDGFNLAPRTYYGAYTRLSSKKEPSLKCSQANDQFTVNTSKGNGALTYPIALITADEVAFAGGVNGLDNEKYYLNFGAHYWTMSPYRFASDYRIADTWYVTSTGYLYPWGTVSASYGLRPVLNLKRDIEIISGNGTSRNPYQVLMK